MLIFVFPVVDDCVLVKVVINNQKCDRW